MEKFNSIYDVVKKSCRISSNYIANDYGNRFKL